MSGRFSLSLPFDLLYTSLIIINNTDAIVWASSASVKENQPCVLFFCIIFALMQAIKISCGLLCMFQVDHLSYTLLPHLS